MITREQQQLNELFDQHYASAKASYSAGNYESAKRSYMLAAETMVKQAKVNEGELRAAMIERAKRIVAMANSITITRKPQPRKPAPKADNPPLAPNNGNPPAERDDDDSVKQWQAAEIPKISFDDVIGLKDVKRAITTRMINPLKHPEIYAKFNKKTGGGVLLYGPPGTGKTMIAKAIAHEVGATFYIVRGSDVVSKWVGESERNIASLFETASAQKLAIIFIDEMDSLFGERGKDTHNDKRVNEFLQQIDGFVGRNPNLLLLGATNRPWDIDSAAVRSGRFSEKIYVPLPDDEARLYMVKKYLSDCPLASDIDYDMIVSLTDGFSGADIDELADRAKEFPLLASIERGVAVPITMADITNAISRITLVNNDSVIKRYEDYAGIKQ